ncbi:LOW QUALITY PROTEIN: hypothetical protein BU14_0245s0003 [Porphyra umbilicalis]|uniref:Uncharacterized protein n=1 Tax=Porphyra umbilicalis TaxID=2786 RepID=A0A1X6P389_PORUM|nr:LOW QUALITY PROTEIN: hypothetical protein BU14_0245s0003 [Porphyra umbilicalis]|eukprot:OSX75220.1 LOW QUALITY PROTEIN: hypothetical protein BU14_0245s0003 [Porphyra umbilicalis]
MDDCRAASVQFWKTDAACRCPPFACPVRINAHEVTMSPFDNIIRSASRTPRCVWRDKSRWPTKKKKDGRKTDVSHDHATSAASSFCTDDWPIPQHPHSVVPDERSPRVEELLQFHHINGTRKSCKVDPGSITTQLKAETSMLASDLFVLFPISESTKPLCAHRVVRVPAHWVLELVDMTFECSAYQSEPHSQPRLAIGTRTDVIWECKMHMEHSSGEIQTGQIESRRRRRPQVPVVTPSPCRSQFPQGWWPTCLRSMSRTEVTVALSAADSQCNGRCRAGGGQFPSPHCDGADPVSLSALFVSTLSSGPSCHCAPPGA